MSDVSQLLTQSRAMHAAYQQAMRNGDPVTEKTNLVAAAELRERANKLDPGHHDPEWRNDKVTHDSYVAFYEHYMETHQ